MTPSTVTVRNKLIKATLKKAFPGIKISVRGATGTAYGYVDVRVAFSPACGEQSRELHGLTMTLLEKAGGDMGHRYTDDTCQFRASEIHLAFETPKVHARVRRLDGGWLVQREYDAPWEVAA